MVIDLLLTRAKWNYEKSTLIELAKSLVFCTEVLVIPKAWDHQYSGNTAVFKQTKRTEIWIYWAVVNNNTMRNKNKLSLNFIITEFKVCNTE